MRKAFLRLGSLMAALAVALGAFGAHTLKEILDPTDLATFQTGVQYHFYHSLALLGIGFLLHFGKKSRLNTAGWLFCLGIVFFSGSLYLLAVSKEMQLNLGFLGPVTPVGGLMFIGGWVMLFLSTYQESDKSK